MKGGTILNIGLGPWQTPLVQAAKARGYAVVGVDRNPLAPGVAHVDAFLNLSTHDSKPILEALQARGLNNDVVRAAITIGSRESLTCAATIARALGTCGPVLDIEAIDVLIDRARFRRFLEDLALPSPAYQVVESPEDAIDLPCPLIVKSTRNTTGSVGLTVVRVSRNLPAAIAYALDAASSCPKVRAIVERYVEGRDIGVLGLFAEGRPRFIAYVEREVDAFPHCLPRHYAVPARLAGRDRVALEAAFLRLARGSGVGSGPFYVEFRLAADGSDCYALEAEPTLPAFAARLAADAYGIDLYRVFIEVVVDGSRAEVSRAEPCGAACQFVYGARPGVIGRIERRTAYRPGCDVWLLRNAGDRVDNRSAESICAVAFATAGDAESASRLARQAAAGVIVEIA